MIRTKRIEYKDSQNTFEGFLAVDTSISEKRPVIMVCHAYGGLSQFEEDKAIELAKLGYVGFASDVYGKGKRATSPDEAQQLMGIMNANRKELLHRLQLSLSTAKSLEYADPSRIGAIGFCFGGKCVLDIARSGANLSGVVSFHGLFDAPDFNKDVTISTPILILHGWDDPLAKPEAVLELTKELTQKGANWEMNAYGNTGHSFTNPKANMHEKGLFFSQSSSDNAWARMESFFSKMFS